MSKGNLVFELLVRQRDCLVGATNSHRVFGYIFFVAYNSSLRDFVLCEFGFKRKVAKVLDHMCALTCELHACQPYQSAQLTWLPRPLRRCASPQVGMFLGESTSALGKLRDGMEIGDSIFHN